MTRYDRHTRAFAATLAAMAGYVDAVAYMMLGGFFVSFMSGNTTRLGVGLAEYPWHAAIAGALIAAFVAGVVIGTLAGRSRAGRHRTTVLLAVTLLLAIAAVLGSSGWMGAAAIAAAMAMGAENAVFARDGEVRFGLTYMTGTLVKLGQNIAGALCGGPALGWLPYLLMWMALATGALIGTWSHAGIGVSALWFAAAVSALLTMTAALGWPGEEEDARPESINP